MNNRKSLPFGRLPCFGDFEASGLAPESYPIAAGWSLPTGEVRSEFIGTEPAWGAYWDPAAEVLHGISRDLLKTIGVSAHAVAAEMNRDLAGEVVYFDGGDYDRRWLSLLFEAAELTPTFKFGNFEVLLAMAGVVDDSRRMESRNMAIRDVGDLRLHDAGNDVRLMQRWYIRARGGMRS